MSFLNSTFESLRSQPCAFVEERDWSQFHTPRSLALALVGEVGEMCELLQWRGDGNAKPGLADWTVEDRTQLGEELADVLSYVLRLADVCEIDLPAAFLDKLSKNRAKYPAELSRGSSAKYSQYRRGGTSDDGTESSKVENPGEEVFAALALNAEIPNGAAGCQL